MGRQKNFFFQNRYFSSAVRYSLLLEIHDNMGKPMQVILKENNLDSNIAWRYKRDKSEGNLQLDLSKVNISANPSAEQCFIDIDPRIVEIAKAMIKEGLSDEEISGKIYTRLKKDGVNMENVKSITLNVALDLGNNFGKVTIGNESKIVAFLNKIDLEKDVTALADNDYINYKGTDTFFIIGNEFSKFEKNKNKNEKNFLPSLFYAIAKAIKSLEIEEDYDQYNINLAILSPINQMKFKGEYIEKIKNDNICECICRVDGKSSELVISIDNVEVYAEGLCAFPMLEDKTNTQVLADVGSQTCNVAVIRNNKVFKVITIDDMGSFFYYSALVKNLNDNEVTTDNIQRYIDDGIVNHDINLLGDYYKKLFTEIKKQVNSKVNKYNIIGGTVELFKSNGITPKEDSNIVFLENSSTVNVLGAKMILDSKFKNQNIAVGE